MARPVRVAAVGDVHFGKDSGGSLRASFEMLAARADVFLFAGDVTGHGDPDEAKVFVRELDGISIGKVAVLGNHDYHHDAQGEIRARLENAGVRVLEGDGTVVDVDGARIAIAGTKGFGGGFADACASDFGEPEMKAFVRHTKALSARLEEALMALEGDVRIALLHYSPAKGTLRGERLPIYPFLGSYLLGEAVDAAAVDLVLHGHAHAGSKRGVTPGGVRVRNVALPVIQRPYSIFRVPASHGS